MPLETIDATAVWHEDKLFVGGGTSANYEDDARLFIYTPTTDTWDTPIDTPVYWFGLTTYHSQLVLVGGRAYTGEELYSNKLYVLNEHNQLEEALPPMRTRRHSVCAVSYRDHLLVAGGMKSFADILNVIEVFSGSHWSFAQPLPVGYFDLKSVILDQHWYLMGGSRNSSRQENVVQCISLNLLLASCQPSETSQSLSIWKILPNTPHRFSTPAVFGRRFMAIGGGGHHQSSSVHAYSFQTNSWIYIGDMPFVASSTCSVVLPTGELMVVGGLRSILKATITGINCMVYYYNIADVIMRH